MKVIHLSISSGGGAGIAAGRSVHALRELGIDAEFWTANGSKLGPAVRRPERTLLRGRLDRFPLRFYRGRQLFSEWSNNWQPSALAAQVNQAEPDIVNLHWVGNGFLSLRELSGFRAPIVWTLHDAWAFTGGCHYPAGCRGYTSRCGRCPQLGSESIRDLSWLNLRAKRASLRDVAAFVTPSAWLAGLAAESGAVASDRLHVIPNGLDGMTFVPMDRDKARRELGLPADAVLLLAGAHDLNERRKGWHLLRGAIERVVEAIPGHYVLVVFGAHSELSSGGWPCEVRSLGTLREEGEIARICSAADVLLMPSLQDNLPNLALEAQACGCPVVGFDSGGLREIVEHGSTGMLAQETTASGLADAARAWLAMAPNRSEVSVRARARFEREFSFSVHGRRIAALYDLLLNERPLHRYGYFARLFSTRP